MELLECFISGEISSLHIRSFLPSNKYQKMIWWCYQHSELVPFCRGELGVDRTWCRLPKSTITTNFHLPTILCLGLVTEIRNIHQRKF